MDIDIVTVICVVGLPALIFLDLYTAQRRKRRVRQARERQYPQNGQDVLVLKEGETVCGVIDRGKGQYTFIANNAANTTNHEEL